MEYADQKILNPVQAPITALLLDDSDVDRTRIRRMNEKLPNPLILDDVATIDAMERHLDRNCYDLILIDYGLTKGNGLGALDCIRNHASNFKAATIMITGNEKTNIVVSAMKRGCNDFVSKAELTPERLVSSINEILSSRLFPFQASQIDTSDIIREEISTALTEAVESDEFRNAVRMQISDLIDDISFAVVHGAEKNKSQILTNLQEQAILEDRIVFEWDQNQN